MSSLSRKAAFGKKREPRGWVCTQADQAWAWLPGSPRILSAAGADVPSLLARARAAGASEKNIPAHWRALPTGLDLQVHLRHPGQPLKETLEGGLESAVYGGYDGIVTMPNTNPFLDHPAALTAAVESAQAVAAAYPVRIGFTASATIGMQGQQPTDIAALKAAGAVAITDDGWGVKDAAAQEAIFAACAANDILFQQHAEMPGHKGVTPEGPFRREHGLAEYPRTAESDMIRRDLALLRKHPLARYHVLHVSTQESIEEIRRAKAEGLRVTAEVTPHHLIFSNHDIPNPKDPRCTYFKMNPPLFGPEDRDALRTALRDGIIDCVSTDHAPHEVTLKSQGWALAPFGTRGLETALPALLQLMHEGHLSFERVVEVFCHAPRRVLAREEFASPTGLLFVDPAVAHQINLSDLPGVSENSCFLGATLHGRIELRAEPGELFLRGV